MDFGDNVWDVEFDPPDEWSEAAEKAGFGSVRGKRLRRQLGATLSSAIWELDPGATQAPYHFHHGGEELLIVLRGTPTLRSPEGERELKEGEVVHFPRGPEGAHQLSNRSSEVARYVIAASLPTPEIIEYPDSGKIASMARTETTGGWPVVRVAPAGRQRRVLRRRVGLGRQRLAEETQQVPGEKALEALVLPAAGTQRRHQRRKSSGPVSPSIVAPTSSPGGNRPSGGTGFGISA